MSASSISASEGVYGGGTGCGASPCSEASSASDGVYGGGSSSGLSATKERAEAAGGSDDKKGVVGAAVVGVAARARAKAVGVMHGAARAGESLAGTAGAVKVTEQTEVMMAEEGKGVAMGAAMAARKAVGVMAKEVAAEGADDGRGGRAWWQSRRTNDPQPCRLDDDRTAKKENSKKVGCFALSCSSGKSDMTFHFFGTGHGQSDVQLRYQFERP